MGVLSIRYKPNFLGILKFLNSFNWFIVFFSLINLSVCIYEDQIGKFDWRQTYVGRIKFSQFDTVSTAKKLIVATEENVLAALNLKTGQVVWRHVLESASSGNIQLLHVSEKVVTVTGSNPYLVRGWDSNTGILLWEWSLTLQNDDTAEFSEWWVQQGMLVHMLPVFASHIEVTMYNLVTGHNKGSTSKLPAVWINNGCVLSPPYYTCVSGATTDRQIFSLDVTSNAVQIINKPLSNYVDTNTYVGKIRSLDGNSAVPGFIVEDRKVVVIENSQFRVLETELEHPTASVTVVETTGESILLRTWTDEYDNYNMAANGVLSGRDIPEIHCSNKNQRIPEPEVSSAMCTTTKEQPVCRISITGGDDAVHLIQQGGRVLWTREEALANVVAAEFVDLPVSDLEAAIESEFDQKEGNIWVSFSRRLHSQFQQLQGLLAGLQADAPDQTPPLHRDYFNLHKIIVLVTEVGKVFGVDNLSGAVVWARHEPRLAGARALVFLRRSASHAPLDAYLTIVGKHVETGNGLIISLNPIRGTSIGEGTLQLDAPLLQAALLPRADRDHLHALVLLDADGAVQVLPASATSLVENMFLYVAEESTGDVQGYTLQYNGREVVSSRTWSLRLRGRIAATASPRPTRGLAAGRVLADRGVLYKHVNPNLVLFVTQAQDLLHKDVASAWCVDVVSGNVVAAQTHRRARSLPLAVLADNFMAYIYVNDKHRRVEIATMELYEGAERWVEAGGAFSSLGGARSPGVERRAYVLPAAPLAAALTHTARALTDRHLLVALSSGSIVEIPWAYLESVPRAADGTGEGGAPAPEVPLPAAAALSYNVTVQRVRRVHAAPAALESTTLVLATGLDLFYTRVAPSKTFDLLKDDFDYYLITVVLAALIVASYATKYFASRKMLKMAWK